MKISRYKSRYLKRYDKVKWGQTDEKEDKRGQKMKWWNDEMMIHDFIKTSRVAVQVWITLCVTLQPPWLDIELSEWILTISYQQWIILL